jgi:queuine tRNA-ribosyltransferase
VFSLAKLRHLSEEGVLFQSHLDGSRHVLSPERSMEVQQNLGADIAMAFDECPPHPAPKEAVAEATARTARWAKRSKEAHTRTDQALFGIVQGGVHLDLREQSTREIVEIGFPGHAIGGLSVGEPKADMHAVLAHLDPILPADKPRYLMGVGTPEDILEGVARGVDMFDCVLPTRNARNGQLFTAPAASPSATPSTAPTRARWTRGAPATPAARCRAPTSATSIWRTRCRRPPS